MKILFASDLHGSYPNALKVIERLNETKSDLLVLLGDLLYHGPRNPLPEGYDCRKVADLLNQYKEKIICVRGNCEAEVDQMLLAFPCLMDYSLIYADGHRFFITHGHLFNEQNLPPLQPNDIFVQGHDHIPVLKKHSDIYMMNPNSASLPKQGVKGYAIYENHNLTLYALDTNEIIYTMRIEGGYE